MGIRFEKRILPKRIFAQLSDLWEESNFASRWLHGAHKVHVQIPHQENMAA
jgi:hypothetical protein